MSASHISVLKQLRIAVYADGANRDDMVRLYEQGWVKGFTTNPTLMAKAGIKDYEGFAKEVLKSITDLPVSFEVFSDDWKEMERQALRIKEWAPNVNVKIPITNTKGEAAIPTIRRLLDAGLKLNVTAILTWDQIKGLHEIMKPKDDVIVSVFAGRIADTGVDPMPVMKDTVKLYADMPGCKVLWASPREVLNIYQADQCGCHIITATSDLIAKLALFNKSLEEYSLDTVKMFYNDAQKAGFQL